MTISKISVGSLLVSLMFVALGCGGEGNPEGKAIDTDVDSLDIGTNSDDATDFGGDTETGFDTGSDSEGDSQKSGSDEDTAEDTGHDLCPDDPNKTEPGECGCGVPEGTCQREPLWRFVVVGDSRGSDTGVNTAVWAHLIEAILDEGAEFVLFPGDLTTSGYPAQFEQWKKTTRPLYESNIGVYAVRGNHDDTNLAAWNDAFSGDHGFPPNGPAGEKNLTYSFSHKNVFVAAIDNYSSSTGINQGWLDVELAQNTQPHVFVFGHEPAFAASHQDCLDDSRSARDRFWENLKDAGCRAYFAGHDHFYDHAWVRDGDGDPDDDVHQFIVGTAGAPLYDFDGDYTGRNSGYDPRQEYFADRYGYILVEIDDMDVRMTFKERSGGSYVAKDTFTYSSTAGR